MRRHLFRTLILTGFVTAGIALEPAGPAPGVAAQRLATPGVGVWWTGASDPARWIAPHDRLTKAVSWRAAGAAVDWAEIEVEAGAARIPVHTVLVRLRPALLRPTLEQHNEPRGLRGVWTIDSVQADAVIALNAGQFLETGPWGWIVTGGIQLSLPRRAPLAGALAFDTAGSPRWLADDDVAFMKNPGRDISVGFQSYPLLLRNGVVPRLIRVSDGVSATHRDARLAIGQLPDGRLLIAMTRFGVRGSALARVPIGLTTRETAALMGSLGCTDALMLDGGLSAQLMIRGPKGETLKWPGARRVPVALVFRNR
jgi:uncharacterized protein YigE (DUF2233 family)